MKSQRKLPLDLFLETLHRFRLARFSGSISVRPYDQNSPPTSPPPPRLHPFFLRIGTDSRPSWLGRLRHERRPLVEACRRLPCKPHRLQPFRRQPPPRYHPTPRLPPLPGRRRHPPHPRPARP